MNRWVLLISIPVLCAAPALAMEGRTIFQSNGCVSCHALQGHGPDEPSLPDLAAAYAGKKAALVDFLDGKGQPIVEPDDFSVMKPQLAKTRALTPEERSALADYILEQ